RADYERHVAELDKHGLSHEQIEASARGAPLPAFDEATWRQALAHNGLWTDAAKAVHAALPPEVRVVPWVIATIGELAANGLLSAELAGWLRATEGAGAVFPAIGALLQRGHTLPDVARLHALGALAPVVDVAAPASDGDWDVHALLVKPGEHVPEGRPVAVLRDPRRMQLVITPLPGEVETVGKAIVEGLPCRATPLVPGSGPTLEGVRIERMLGADGERGTIALATVANEPLAATAEARTWRLRAGTRYQVRVPQRAVHGAFVLPAAALARDGSRQIVLIRDEHGIEA